jgi:type II secretory ATPase GspE/PulE/Tfp pilus assembly ATPase PilB-like protein
MKRINQTRETDIGLLFSGLRTLVRQHPDIIMVGEIRDNETASLAVALTGHLC